MSDADYATFDTTELRAMHYMMLSHDLTKSPGRYRKGPVYVNDERADKVVYTAPEAADVPALMEALAATLHTGHGSDPIVRSAMAHLNLVMIHPFRDGNGRMARALATLVLSRSDIGKPEFSSIEEWLGANTEDYYSVLAHTGHGSWKPRGDAHLWLAFILRAHHMQAQTLARRVAEAGQTWVELEALTAGHGLHERTLDAMYARSPRLPDTPQRLYETRRGHRAERHERPGRAHRRRHPGRTGHGPRSPLRRGSDSSRDPRTPPPCP